MRDWLLLLHRSSGLWIASALLILVTLAGCASDRPASEGRPQVPVPSEALVLETEGRIGGRLNYSLPGEPSSFNVVTAQNTRTSLVTSLTTGTLLEFDHQHLALRPGVVRNWSLSEDSTAVRFELRKGLRFSDGHPLTVDDIIFTFDRLFEEGSQNALGASLRIDGQPLGYRRLDESSVEITFPRKFAAAEYILSTIPVLPRHLLEDADRRIEDYWGLDADPAGMAGLGPFVIAEHVPARKTVLRYNPHYWKTDRQGRRLPYLDEISIHYIPRRDTQILRLEAGELDLLDSQVRPGDLHRLADKNFQLLDAGSSMQLKFLWFNQGTGAAIDTSKKEWFNSLSSRQAVSFAINRRAIVETVFQGKAEEAWSLVPSSLKTWHVTSTRRYPYDPEKARRLLIEGGFSWSEAAGGTRLIDASGQPVKFQIFSRSDPQWGRSAAMVQQDLEQLGIEVAIRQEEFRALISRVMRSRDYDAAIMGMDFPYEPFEHQNVLLSYSPMHFWNPAQASPATEWEAELDRLVLRQITELNLEDRKRIHTRIQELLAEQLPLVPLVNHNVLVIASPIVRGLKPSPLHPHTLWNSWELSL